MAESKDKKNSKTQNSFADDLDLMLNLDDTSEQQVDHLIDDDEAIDRLLMPDAFEDEEQKESELTDIDKMIADKVEKDDKAAEDFDEFGDDADYFIPDFQLKPDVKEAIDKDETALLDEPEREHNVELTESSEEAVIDEFFDDAQVKYDSNAEFPAMDKEEVEQMAEIDEFGDDTEQVNTDNADFILADFDISADDTDDGLEDEVEFAKPGIATKSGDELSSAIHEKFDEELVSETSDSTLSESEVVTADLDEDQSQVSGFLTEAELESLQVQLTEKLAEVNLQLNELKKQQTQLRQDIQQKGSQDELVECQENLNTLKTEQRKVKRNVDTLLSQKPVVAYVAIAIAIIALVVGGGLGFQGYIAKLQLKQIADFLGKIQEQVNAAPATEAAETEALRKQLDELALSNSTNATQLAEFSKLIHGDETDASLSGLNKRFEKLNDQDMQMGAAIESLQNKVAALEKGKHAATAKSNVKKQPVVQENWAVNLVAYKQDWYAKRKAEEFGDKGVPAIVNKVVSKGETWYRLVVDGFKSQYEAAAYAARIKKTLNLDSVWVAKVNK